MLNGRITVVGGEDDVGEPMDDVEVWFTRSKSARSKVPESGLVDPLLYFLKSQKRAFRVCLII